MFILSRRLSFASLVMAGLSLVVGWTAMLPEALASTFYSLQLTNRPPVPFDPWPELPRWSLGSDIFLIDDSSVDYESMQENPLSPPDPGSGGPVGDSQDWPAYSYTGCGLGVEIAATTDSSVSLTLHNTTPGTNYQILSRTNIEATSWVVETNVAGANGQDYTTVAIPMAGRPKVFFRAAENRTYVLETHFAGLAEPDSGTTPPDTMGAVGPNHFVELLNNYIAVFDKTDGTRFEATNSINLFFAAPGPTNNAIDPRIVYDQQAERWIAVAIDYGGSKNIRLAVTTNNSPLGLTNWTRYEIPMSIPNCDTDHATLGLDGNGIYITAVHRTVGGTNVPYNAGHTVIAIKKPDIYLGADITNILTRIELGTNASETKVWTIQPAVNFDSVTTNAYAWLVAKGPPQLGSNYQGGAIQYRRLQWSNTTALMVDTNWIAVEPWSGANYRNYYDIEGTNQSIASSASNVRAPQAGGTETINLGYVGSRLINALVRNGFLYTCHHVGLSETNGVYFGNETGTNVTRSGVQWFKFRLESSGSLSYYKHDRIYDSAVTNALYYYFPSIAVNCASDILLGFSGSGSTNSIAAYYAWRPAFGSISALPVRFYEVPQGYYDDDRWGDYSFTTVDPIDSTTFWTVQAHSTAAPLGWGTRIGKLKKGYQ